MEKIRNFKMLNLKENLTKQEAFDFAARHLLTQMEKSLGKDDLCEHRGANGKMCAYGIFLSDDEAEKFYGYSCPTLYVNGIFPKRHEHLYDLMNDLQLIHDDYEVDEWKQKLFQLAEKYNLDNSVLKVF